MLSKHREHFKFDNKDKLIITDKEPNTINYFLPGPNQANNKRVSTKSHSSYREIFKMYLLE